MEHNFWHERWQRGEIGFHQEDINPHLAAFWSQLDIPATAKVFVPLCGKSRDLLWLRQQGHAVVGVELSPIAAADFYRESGLAPAIANTDSFEQFSADLIEILCGDFFQLESRHLTDVAAVYDRASLVALPPPMRAAYASHLHRILPLNCQILLVSFDYDQAAMPGPPFAVTSAKIASLYGEFYQLKAVHSEDLMLGVEGERWRVRGLIRMVETVLLLTPK